MYDLPSADRYDLACVVASVALLVFGYVIYPAHLVKITVWLVIFVISVAWMAYFGWRWAYDMEANELLE